MTDEQDRRRTGDARERSLRNLKAPWKKGEQGGHTGGSPGALKKIDLISRALVYLLQGDEERFKALPRPTQLLAFKAFRRACEGNSAYYLSILDRVEGKVKNEIGDALPGMELVVINMPQPPMRAAVSRGPRDEGVPGGDSSPSGSEAAESRIESLEVRNGRNGKHVEDVEAERLPSLDDVEEAQRRAMEEFDDDDAD